MKRKLLAIALGGVFALPAFANNEIDTGYTPPAQVSTLGAQQMFVNAELGLKANQLFPQHYGHPVVASK